MKTIHQAAITSVLPYLTSGTVLLNLSLSRVRERERDRVRKRKRERERERDCPTTVNNVTATQIKDEEDGDVLLPLPPTAATYNEIHIGSLCTFFTLGNFGEIYSGKVRRGQIEDDDIKS